MGPLATQLLLESALAPCLLAGLVLVAASILGWNRKGTVAPALAIILAVSTTSLLTFGLPVSLSPSARTKIMLAAVIGLIIGIAAERRISGSRVMMIAGAIGLPVWVGLPVLQQGRPDIALIILPIAAVLAAPFIAGRARPSERTSLLLMILATALGLAAIAAFARALSFAALSSALASAVFAILVLRRHQPTITTLVTATAVLLAVTSALLLYSNASLLALLVLGAVIAAERLAHLTQRDKDMPVPALRVLGFCLLPAAAAILLARLDAGPISIY